MKAIWLLPLALLVAGCSQQDTSKLEDNAQQIAKSTGDAAKSITLAGKVSTVLRSMKKIDKSDIHVDAKDGLVTLSGSAVDESQKQFIIDTANGVEGVDKVVDHMVLAK
jgi:osmotically-inducible protein OsmY